MGKGHLFQGNREQRPNFEGNRGTKTILGNREYIYIKIGEQANLYYQGSNGTGPPLEAFEVIMSSKLSSARRKKR